MPVSEARIHLIGWRKALTMSERERHGGNHACLKENARTLLWGLFSQDAPQGHTLSESALSTVFSSAWKKYRVWCFQPFCFSVGNFFPQ